MATSSHLPAISTVIFLFTIISSSSSDMSLIESLCQNTHNVNLCISTLSGDQNAMKCQVPDCVARVAVIHALKNASDAHNLALDLTRKGPPPEQVRPLQSCSEIYVNVMTYMSSCLGYLDRLDYKGAEGPLSTAGTQAAGCEKGFGSHPSPMSQANDWFQKMLDVAFGIVNSLVSKGQ